MKKLLVILVSALLISINYISPAFGDTFNSSITVRPDEILVADEGQEVTVLDNGISLLEYDEDDGCKTDIILTPYASINSVGDLARLSSKTIFQTEKFFPDDQIGVKDTDLPAKIIADLESAYQSIQDNINDLSGLTPEIIAEARNKGVEVSDLLVRDLFDITKRYDGEGHFKPKHDVYGLEDIIIKAKSLKRFVCLLHYKNGAWNVVHDVEILDDTTLRVSVASLSPFAIVLANEDTNPVSPKQDEEESLVIVEPGDTTPGQVEPITPITPVEPVEPIEPVTPVEPVEPHKGCCIYHWLIILTMIITIIINLIFKIKKVDNDLTDEEREKLIKRNKKNTNRRHLVMIINLILCIIFYILGSCCLDIIALALDIIVLVLFVISTRRINKKNEKE